MASSCFGSMPPRPEVIRVLVGALGDESMMVRKAAMSALQENASSNSLLVLDCCTSVFRGGRRRFGQGGSYIACVFQIMAFTVRVMDDREIDAALMTKLAKVATSEMTISKVKDQYSLRRLFVTEILDQQKSILREKSRPIGIMIRSLNMVAFLCPQLQFDST